MILTGNEKVRRLSQSHMEILPDPLGNLKKIKKLVIYKITPSPREQS